MGNPRLLAVLVALATGCGGDPGPEAGAPDAGPMAPDAAAGDPDADLGPDAEPPADAGPLPSLSFEEGDQSVYVGDVFTNPLVVYGSTTGIVFSYSSSDPTVASVDANGEVTTLKSGYATITVTAGYAGGLRAAGESASYDTLVSFVASAWVGEDDTELSFTAGATGAEMYRSSAPDCDITNYMSCPDGEHDTLVSGQFYTDHTFTLARPGYYTYEVDGVTYTLPMSHNGAPALASPNLVAFHDRLWIVGGYGKTSYSNAVWSSYDGINWFEETAAAAFAPRYLHNVVVFDDKMWLIGGTAGSVFSDMWWSDDGVTWNLVDPAPGFLGRYDAAVFIFDNRLWVAGGWGSGQGDQARNDVWSSPDGINWTEENPDAGFPGGSGHRVMQLGSTLYLVINDDSTGANEVWTSTNGKDWTQLTADAGFPARIAFSAVAFEDRMWLVGGWSGGDQVNEVWSSQDGVTWTQADAAPFLKRYRAGVVAFDNRLWVVGGLGDTLLDDVWTSLDGHTWEAQTSESGFAIRAFHHTVNFNGTMFVYGGFSGSDIINDIWSSTDGVTWTQEADEAPFPPRPGATMLEFNGALWMLGGLDRPSVSCVNEVWSSTDGVNWTQATVVQPFTARCFSAGFVLDGEMWLVGGGDVGSSDGAVWSFPDGVTWTERLQGPFGKRSGHDITVLDGVAYLTGGGANGGSNDVWSSDDGVTWNPLTTTAPWGKRYHHRVVALDGTLYLIAGEVDLAEVNDVWASTNGADWTQVTAAAAFSPRSSFGAFASGGALYIVAGHETSSYDEAADVWRSSDGATWRRAHRTVISF